MEAARKSDEAKETQATAMMSAPTGKDFQEEVERMTSAAAMETAPPHAPEFARPADGPPVPASPSTLPPGVVSRPKVDEVLVCSAQGEVLYEWQCAHTDLWVNFFEFISQRGQRLAQVLPLGEFNRLEILSGGVRAVVIIANERGVLVKTRRAAVSA